MPVAMSAGINKQRVETSVRFAAFLLVAASGVALSLTERLLLSSIILLGTTAAAWPMAKKPSRSNFWEIASFLYLIFFLLDLFRLSSSLAPALVHLFIFIIINKIFNLHTYRDYYQLYLLTFLTILAASSLSVEVQMFYVIVIYIILLIWNVLSLTLYKEWQKQDTDEPFPFSFFKPAYWLVVVVASILTFGVAMAIFFILPRIQLGYFSNVSAGKVQHVSGFSQKVSLGDARAIQEDSNIAMRVRVTSNIPTNENFYWRGMAFDRYDGHAWSVTNPGSRFLYQDSSGDFYNARNANPNEELVKQEFFMAPLDTRVIFGLDRVIRLNGNFSAITRDDNGTLTGMGHPESYTIYSRMNIYSISWLRSAGLRIPENVRRYYLQLPPLAPRISDLARRIGGNQKTPYDRVVAVKKYLEANYAYTTTDLPRSSDDPISAFLFEKKAGHCEYFATSMVLLIRSLGIPARLVNGFLEGEYNEIGDFYAVRQSDAHSWVEVYFDGAWVRFDPSPRQVAPRPGSGSSFLAYLNMRKVFDSISFFWDRYILIFSGQDQLDAISMAQEKYHELKQNVQNKSRKTSGYLNGPFFDFVQRRRIAITLVMAGALALLLLLRHYLRWKRQRDISRTPVLFYQEMLTTLARFGFIRPAQKTPAEFVRSIADRLPNEYEQDLMQITQLFYRSRFGNYNLTSSEQRTVRASLQHLQQLR